MICKHCGAEIAETEKVCPMCNSEVETVSEKREGTVVTENEPAPKLSIKALVGFIVSLAGVLVLAIPCGVVGLVFSALGIKEMNTLSKVGRGFVISGLIVSIVDIILGIYNLCVSLI